MNSGFFLVFLLQLATYHEIYPVLLSVPYERLALCVGSVG